MLDFARFANIRPGFTVAAQTSLCEAGNPGGKLSPLVNSSGRQLSIASRSTPSGLYRPGNQDHVGILYGIAGTDQTDRAWNALF
jgi:hypothetical protein